jgi:hypothetical protein
MAQENPAGHTPIAHAVNFECTTIRLRYFLELTAIAASMWCLERTRANHTRSYLARAKTPGIASAHLQLSQAIYARYCLHAKELPEVTLGTPHEPGQT